MKRLFRLLAFLTFFLSLGLGAFAADLDPQALQQLQALPADVQAKIIQEYQKGSVSPNPVSEKIVTQTVKTPAAPAYTAPPAADRPEKVDLPAGLSLLERQFRGRYQSSLAAQLDQFGYNLFSAASSRVAQKVVPNDNYLITPGDQIRIRLWGTTEDTQYISPVDADGTINVPKIGVVAVAGERLGQLNTVIGREVQKYTQGVNVSVTLETLHSVEVYVVGEVGSPGLHVVPAFSTLFKGLQAAGGVKKSGTLRRITLYRNGQANTWLDLYDLILKGNRQADQILQDGDVIFVPRIGRTAALAGAVYQAGIFELQEEKTVEQLLALGGGLLTNAYSQALYVKYYDAANVFQVEDIRPGNQDALRRAMPAGGLLEVPFIPEDRPDTVRLMGHVKVGQTFNYASGLTLKDILHSIDELKPEAFLDHALLHRYNPATTRYEVQKFPLGDFFAGTYQLPLQPYDTIEILSRADLGIKENVSVSGAVWRPGTYGFHPGLTVADLLVLAGAASRITSISTATPTCTATIRQPCATRLRSLICKQP
ncbi:MAG: SLBB domain-containing protein [Deltaproteobacteria bacterium]|nr:SLBB domain-containing protein [Candidatus Anaeroferrophillus wilburensis]MBN2888891.1 SLBB domain-containing protein [Deltaproteobacteria bacterium]